MNLDGLDFSEEFDAAFTRSRDYTNVDPISYVVRCEFCNTTHVAAAPNVKHNKGSAVGELLSYYEAAHRGQDVVMHQELGYVPSGVINGIKFTPVCKCKKWVPYMNFIASNRDGIEEFLRMISSKISLANGFANKDLAKTKDPSYYEDNDDVDDIPF